MLKLHGSDERVTGKACMEARYTNCSEEDCNNGCGSVISSTYRRIITLCVASYTPCLVGQNGFIRGGVDHLLAGRPFSQFYILNYLHIRMFHRSDLVLLQASNMHASQF